MSELITFQVPLGLKQLNYQSHCLVVEEPKQASSPADDSAPVDVSRLLLKVGK